jgi:hypothetical protein
MSEKTTASLDLGLDPRSQATHRYENGKIVPIQATDQAKEILQAVRPSVPAPFYISCRDHAKEIT